MSNFTLKNSKLVDNLQKATNTFISTPEPSEACELEPMYVLADWL